MVVVFGYKERGEFLGWNAAWCPFCKLQTAFECYAVRRKSTLYGIEQGDEYTAITECYCFYCLCPTLVFPPAAVSVRAAWNKSEGLQLLADETNPTLGSLSESRASLGVAESDLDHIVAGLVAYASDLPPDRKTRKRGFVIGLAVGAVIGLLMAYAMRLRSIGNLVSGMIMPGLFFGLVGMAVADRANRRRNSRSFYSSRIAALCGRHNLTIERFAAAAQRVGARDEALVKALGVLRSGAPTVGPN